MREVLSGKLSLRQVARVVPLVLFGALLVVVASVGLVGFVAETQQTWQWYFRMEQAIATLTPVAVALSGASIVALFGAVLLTDE